MVVDLAKGIEEIVQFVDAAVDCSIGNGNMNLLVETANKMYKLVEETACFIGDYVKQSPRCKQPTYSVRHYLIPSIGLARAINSLSSPEDQTKIKDFTERFTAIRGSFDRALIVETFKQAKEIGNYILLASQGALD